MARYAIGDIHGSLLTLRALIEEQMAPSKDDLLVFLGDYVDRGPESRGVLDYLMNKLKGKTVIIIGLLPT